MVLAADRTVSPYRPYRYRSPITVTVPCRARVFDPRVDRVGERHDLARLVLLRLPLCSVGCWTGVWLTWRVRVRLFRIFPTAKQLPESHLALTYCPPSQDIGSYSNSPRSYLGLSALVDLRQTGSTSPRIVRGHRCTPLVPAPLLDSAGTMCSNHFGLTKFAGVRSRGAAPATVLQPGRDLVLTSLSWSHWVLSILSDILGILTICFRGLGSLAASVLLCASPLGRDRRLPIMSISTARCTRDAQLHLFLDYGCAAQFSVSVAVERNECMEVRSISYAFLTPVT